MGRAGLASAAVHEVLSRTEPFEEVHLRFFWLPESEIAQTLRDVGAGIEEAGIEVTTCLRRTELEVDLRYRKGSPGAAEMAQKLLTEIERRHARNLVSRDGESTDAQVARLLAGHKIAFGESCTGGLLAARLIDRAGSSAYVAGGVVAYSNEAKTAMLGVPAELIETHGAVSPEVARALADGARERFGADIGVGITGVAGPGGGTEEKPVGLVCFCVTTSDGTVREMSPVLPGGRSDIRDRSTDVAMNILRAVLVGS